jgi:hypothetical protein
VRTRAAEKDYHDLAYVLLHNRAGGPEAAAQASGIASSRPRSTTCAARSSRSASATGARATPARRPTRGRRHRSTLTPTTRSCGLMPLTPYCAAASAHVRAFRPTNRAMIDRCPKGSLERISLRPTRRRPSCRPAQDDRPLGRVGLHPGAQTGRPLAPHSARGRPVADRGSDAHRQAGNACYSRMLCYCILLLQPASTTPKQSIQRKNPLFLQGALR